jgi:hypothetical protein
VRLRRNGDTFRAYYGTNGTSWTLLAGPVTQVMAADLFVGTAATSHNTAQTTVAEFRDLDNMTYPGATLAISPQPASQTVQEHQAVTFSATGVTTVAPASEVHYQWQRSPDGTTWTNIPGANGTSVSIQFPTGDDDGDSFRVVASIPGATETSAAATLTLTPDTVRPRLRAAFAVSQTKVILLFTEPMGLGAGDPFPYSIDQGINVANAVFAPGNPMRIDVDITGDTPMTLGTTYTITATATEDAPGIFSGVTDPAGNPVDPNPATASFVAQNYPGDPNTLAQLPTNTKRALGSLTDRGFNGRMVQVGAAIANTLATAESMLAGTYLNPATGQPYPNIAPQPTFVETGIINYVSSGAGGRIPGDVQFPGFTAAADNMAMEALTYVELRPGIYRMGVNSDDGFRVTPATGVSDPNNSIVLGFFDGGRGVTDTVFDFLVQEEGLYPMRLIWEEGQGDAAVEWWVQSLVDSTYIAVNANDTIRAFRPPSVAPPPTITVTLGSGTITLSWTDSEGVYQLQASPSLTSASWNDLSGAVGVGGNFSITISSTSPTERYFRLRKP